MIPSVVDVDFGFLLRDDHIADVEKLLDLKFSCVVSSLTHPTSNFRTKTRSLKDCKVEHFANGNTLAIVGSNEWSNFLTLAAAAQEQSPLSTFTVVTPTVGAHANVFSGWNVVKEWNQPWIWKSDVSKSLENTRSKHNIRVYHSWAIPPDTPTGTVWDADPLFAIPGYTGLNLCFSGTLRGADAEILTDTGASDNYLSEAYCKANAIPYEALAEPEALQLGDNTSKTNIVGSCTVTLKIQKLTRRVRFRIIDLNRAFSAIIGAPTLQQWRAIIDMNADEITIPGRTPQQEAVVIHPVERGRHRLNKRVGAKHTRRGSGKLLSIRQVEREIQKGTTVFMAMVRQASPDAPPLTVDQEADPDDEGVGPVTIEDAPKEVRDILLEYAANFEPPPSGLPPARDTGHTIPLEPGHAPPWRPLYRLSPAERDEAEKQIKDYLAKGWIRPSKSPYGAPILFVKKKDGTLRMCIDYRALNKITIKNRYPLPRIDDLFDRLQGAQYFSSFDLSQGYHQIRMTDEDVPKTAFNSPVGHFEFCVLSFGLTNAPATFQTVMNGIFGSTPFCLVYLDDILVFSKTLEEHRVHLRTALELIRENQLYCKLSKCSFLKRELEYLGHLISAEGLRVNPKKVAALTKFPRPQVTTELRSFLGMANYFRKFIKNYATIAAPLSSQTGKNAVLTWPPECEAAFVEVKRLLTSAPVLALPDPDKTFVIESDASITGIGAVLLQDEKPVAYESR